MFVHETCVETQKEWFNDKFKLVSSKKRTKALHWPSQSTDLNPSVYKQMPTNLNELKQRCKE